MVYAEFGGQTECIMGNWKIENRLCSSLLPFTLIPQYLKRFNLIKNTLQTKFEDKTVKSTQLSLVPVGLHDFQIFPDRAAHA